MSCIPSKEADFIDWSENLVAMLLAHKTELGLTDDKIAEIQALHVEVKALHEKCQTASYTKVDMEAKKEKKALLVHLEEVFVRNNLQNNNAMTGELRVAFGIPIHDTKPTPVPVKGFPKSKFSRRCPGYCTSGSSGTARNTGESPRTSTGLS